MMMKSVDESLTVKKHTNNNNNESLYNILIRKSSLLRCVLLFNSVLLSDLSDRLYMQSLTSLSHI